MPNKHRPLSRIALVFWTILLGLVPLTTPASADAKLEGTKPAQWRVVWTSDPATNATVSWSTADAGDKHVLHIESVDGKEKRAVQAESGRYAGGDPELYYHHARLSELKPGTRYNVVMDSDGERSPPMYFVTAPSDDVPFSLLFGGDSRSGAKARREMNAMIAEMAAKNPQLLALVHGGDYVASGARLSQWSEWLSDHELTTGSDGRLLPIVPARGNHDSGPPFNDVFGFPKDDKNYYAVNLSPQVRLITLNSNISAGGDQAQWLDHELAESRGKNRWVLAQYHRPAYPAVKSPGSALQHWVPLFEKHNVDLVCEADGHVLKRTVPIRDGKHDPTGVVYVGEGGLGVGQRTPRSGLWYLEPPGMAAKGHHIQMLNFGPDKLLYEVVLLGGKVADRYEFSPRHSE
jgi:hypothetical protein